MSSTCWGFNLFLFFLVPKGRIWYLKNKTEKSLDPSHFLITVNFPLSISFTYPTSSAKVHFHSHLLEKVFSFPWAVVFHSHISLVVLGPVLGFHNVCPTLSALFPLWPRGLRWHLCRFTNLFLVEYRVFRCFFPVLPDGNMRRLFSPKFTIRNRLNVWRQNSQGPGLYMTEVRYSLLSPQLLTVTTCDWWTELAFSGAFALVTCDSLDLGTLFVCSFGVVTHFS